MNENKQWIYINLATEDIIFKKTGSTRTPWRAYPVLTNKIFNVKVNNEWEAQVRE